MVNKAFEIRRADMENIKEYSVWKHANEEVWEVFEKKDFTGENSLIMEAIRRVMEFDWKGGHYRIFRKGNDMFIEEEYDEILHETIPVAHYQFTEENFVRITFKDADTDVTPAATLPKGWNWVENLDESGYLEDPEGKAHFVYEVQYINTCADRNTLQRIVHHGFDNHICDVFGCLDEKTYGTGVSGFKRKAEYIAKHEKRMLEARTLPAATLPSGWNWVLLSNDTGHLEAPNKQHYFCFRIKYLLGAEIVQYCCLEDNVSYDYVGFGKFQKYAERRIRTMIVNHLSVQLIRAVKNNDAGKVLELIEAGADVNYKDGFGLTALNWATNHADSHIIEVLILHGADANHSDRCGMTKLMQVSSYGNVAIVKYLLEHGANRNAKDNSGRTAADYVKECLNCDNVSEKRTEDYKEIIRLLESTSNERAKYEFGNVVLPCDELKDFEIKDVSMDIPCRIYLTQAPSEKVEKLAKELDGEFYSPDNFFIEGTARKNSADGEWKVSDWTLRYALESGHIYEFGYVEDVPDSAWEYFKEYIGIDKKEFELCVTWEMCGKVKVKAETLEEAMELFYEYSDGIKLPEGDYVDGSFQLSTTDPDEMASMTKQVSK